MSRCPHGIFLPKDPKFGAKDVCFYCKQNLTDTKTPPKEVVPSRKTNERN